MTDTFKNHTRGLTSPPEYAVPVTTSETLDLPSVTRALYVGSTGTLKVQMAGGGLPVILKNVPAGTLLPIRVSRVFATGTTAADIIGFW